MKRFHAQATPLTGLQVIERQRLGDSRGFLSRLFAPEAWAEFGWHGPVAQLNHTRTERAGTARGLHYQVPPFAEIKIVTCMMGKIFDVAVDVRKGSPTFLKWFGLELDGEGTRSLFIPPGFAHGFQALTDDVEMLYVHSQPYAPEHERGLALLDPRLNIAWPAAIAHLSSRDQSFAALDKTFEGVTL